MNRRPTPVPEKPLQTLKNSITTKRIFLKKESSIVLVCGANSDTSRSSARDILLSYGKKQLKNFEFFQAEQVFLALKKNKGYKKDLLYLEDKFSDFADCIIMILESPGTLAEIGAFAMKEKIAKITIVINDVAFKNDQSFINLGPISRIDRLSKFGTAIFGRLSNILLCITELEKKLELIEHKRRKSYDITTFEKYKLCSPKIKILFLADLFSIFSPMSVRDLQHILTGIFGISKVPKNELEIGMLEALGLICHNEKENLYNRSIDTKGLYFDYDGFEFMDLRTHVVRNYHKYYTNRIEILKNRLIYSK